MTKHDELIGWGGSVFGGISTVLQANELFQLIQAILSILVLLVTLGYTIWKWYKKAKKDGKITEEEYDELVDNLKDFNKGDKK